MNKSHHALPFSPTAKRYFRLSALAGLVLASQTALAVQESEQEEEEKNSLGPYQDHYQTGGWLH